MSNPSKDNGFFGKKSRTEQRWCDQIWPNFATLAKSLKSLAILGLI